MTALLYLPFYFRYFTAHLLAGLACSSSSSPYGGYCLHSVAASFLNYAGLASPSPVDKYFLVGIFFFSSF